MRGLIEPSHLDLCGLQKPIIIACGSERVIHDKYFSYSSAKRYVVDPHLKKKKKKKKKKRNGYIETSPGINL